jgi:putative ABC transport system permease protein
MAGSPMCSANESRGAFRGRDSLRAGEWRVTLSLGIFWRLMIRPLAREQVRTALTVFAVALGVAVVLAMDLAGEAATGSFHSSLESLAGDENFEITATGGVPEEIAVKLATLPYDWQVTPRMEDYAVLARGKKTLPLVGLDLIGEGRRLLPAGSRGFTKPDLAQVTSPDSVWVGESLGQPGDELQLFINDGPGRYTVRGTFPDAHGSQAAIVMDIAAAQSALGRPGRVDRIYLRVRDATAPASLDEWQRRARQVLPEGIEIRPAGASTGENRKMLAAFRWNLRLLSYIALVVGAFLIYNTISVSVVRRRAEIGIARALGASRGQVFAAFLLEAAVIGTAGALVGIPLGRLMASSAVRLLGATVSALYVSSRPGDIVLSGGSVALALLVGTGLALVSAWSPAREAARVPPVEAMARGRREFEVRVRKTSGLWLAAAAAVAAGAVSRLPPIGGRPVFGYLATLLAVAASALAIPAFTALATGAASRALPALVGVEALLASRSLSASLRRTSVLVAALSTAVAMVTAVAIMVGSFRETVVLWMESELPADLYVRPGGSPAADQHPTISPQLSDAISGLAGVKAVERMRAYEISYQGLPATLGSLDLKNTEAYRSSDFLSGRSTREVLAELRGTNSVIVSEPFSYKHRLERGDTLELALGESRAPFRIADVYYDYSSERGFVLMDRDTLLKYLPDPAPSNLAVFVSADAQVAQVRTEIENAAAARGARVLVFVNSDLRGQAVQIFDRTFAITYALEAVAALVAILGVAGALLALVIDRRRELGLLRYLGASSRQLRKLILTEAGLLGLLATISGAVLGVFLSLILIFVINKQSFGWTIRLHWPVAVLLGALSLLWLLTLLAGCYPARTAVRLNPLEVVHEE